MSPPPAEFRVVAACCRWPPSAGRDLAILEAACAPIDWARVVRIAERHRVEGLLSDGLAGAGVEPCGEVRERLRQRAARIARQSLLLAAESARLQRLLTAAGVQSMVLKGAAVEMLAYGRLGLKNAWDIDLLVAPANVGAAKAQLEEAGYDLVHPAGLSPAQLRTWVELTKECVFRGRESGLIVELHWRLVDSQSLLGGLSAASSDQTVDLGAAGAVRTLGDDGLFAHLCVHGASHGWWRLKWLADVNAFAARSSQSGLVGLYRRCLELGAGRSGAQALLLCERLFGTALPGALRAEIAADRPTLWLTKVAIGAMTGEADLEKRPLTRSQVFLSQFLLLGGRAYPAAELRRRWISLSDRTRIELPRPLFFVYDIIRLPMIFWRHRPFRRRRAF